MKQEYIDILNDILNIVTRRYFIRARESERERERERERDFDLLID